VCATVAVLTLTACSRSSDGVPRPTAAGPQLATVERLVEQGTVVADDPRLERGAYAFLDRVGHPVLTSARTFAPELHCDAANDEQPKGPRPCRASIPARLPDAPFAIFVTQDDRPAGGAPADAGLDPMRTEPSPQPSAAQEAAGAADLGAPVHDDHGIRTVLLERGATVDAGTLTSAEMFFARVTPAPPLAERALSTEPFVVPPDALLRLSIGIEEIAWTIDSAPVFFRVVVEDEHGGAQQDLFRRILDPARRPADRRWFDSDIDLTDLAGKKVRLRFLSEPAESGDTRPSLPLWGDPRVLATQKPRVRPSIVLVSIDTLRAKSMSTYGAAFETSPNITALAKQGALFERAYTTFSNTLPSHMSMMTGLYPVTHEVIAPPAVLGERHVTLAETLRSAGYVTAAFTEDALLDSHRGFRRGFSSYFENTTISTGAGDSPGTFGRALEWAGRNADEGFFLFVHTYEVHDPYLPPEPYASAFDTPEAKALAASQRAYLQEIRYVDDVLQRLVAGLRKVVPEQDLLLIVTADHGEEFLEHGMVSHTQLFDEVMHIPMVMVWSGRIPAGLRIATPVSLVDVMPTILALAGVAIPDALEGKSLVPLLHEPPGDIGRDVVFGESPPFLQMAERRFVARSADEKCILTASGAGDACFDLARDPDEQQPHAPQETAAFARLHDLGNEYRERAIVIQRRRDDQHRRAHAGTVAATAAAAARPAPAGEPAEPAPAIERKLRALGYTQ